ncbi:MULTISPECIES: hypothetical protein [unclassified Bradyrhizobium]|uniref:hypothetical protein n=1 Tax=unclassified Bradyrhizobium TaxID=2631580 RepID=UPI0028EAC08C|nr:MULTISPECIES: hypothetical protein [unclassified Bradyrhizobium]
MERWQFIRWGIAASVLAHLLIAGGVVVSTTVRPYEIARTDEVAVDIVDADDPQKTPEPVPSPSPELTLPQPAPSPSPAAAAPPPAPELAQPPVQEAKEMPKPPSPSPALPQPSPMPPSKAVKTAAKAEAKSAAKPLPPPVPAPAPSYVPPEPDITVKYGVMLGLPEPLSPLPPAIGPDDAKDAGPAATTNLAANLETALRQRVRSCARLSASMSPSDRVMVRLRFAMTPDGRLATEPEVREVIAPLKAAQLKESAVEALNACQPYSMLPRDRYDEWKVIEMSFTPQDFTR